MEKRQNVRRGHNVDNKMKLGSVAATATMAGASATTSAGSSIIAAATTVTTTVQSTAYQQ